MFGRYLFFRSPVPFTARNNKRKPTRSKQKTRLLAERLEVRVTPAAFTPGDLVVERVGGAGGTNPPASFATRIFLDEYTPAGAFVQSVALPTSGNGLLTASGSDSSEGLLTLSTNGEYLAVPGYAAPPNVFSIATTSTTNVPRAVDLLDSSGSVASVTTTTSFDANSIRSAVASGSGANLQVWMTGSNTGVVTNVAGGNGAGTVVSSSPNTNLLGVNIFGGQLFVSAASGSIRIAAIGTGTPTTNGNTQTELPGISSSNTRSPGGFFFANLGSGNNFDDTGMDTLYVADSRLGLAKYSYDGTTWSLNGAVFGPTSQDLVGIVNGPTDVQLFITSTTGRIETITDTSGLAGNLAGLFTTIATAPTNTSLRGIAFTPDDGPGTLGGLGSTTPYTLSAAATQLGASAIFSGLSSFNGGNLTVHIASGGMASDKLTIGAFGNITLSGSSVLDNGAQIGTFSGGTGGSDLVITFDSVVNTNGPGGAEFTVTSAQVQDLLQAVAFASTGTPGARSINVTIVKNGGIDSSSATQAVNVISAAVPTLDNAAATAVTVAGATLNATLEDPGLAAVTDYGFFYEAGTVIDGNAVKVDLGPGSPGTPPVSFFKAIAGLSATTVYSIEGYAANANGTGFSAATTFKTEGAPDITSPTATGIHAALATLGGDITSTNGLAITDHGIVYSTNPAIAPVINGAGVTQLSLGSGDVGVFSAQATGLTRSTTYYYAAYATNSFGTTYTSTGTFTTFANPTISQNRLAAATNGVFAITSGALLVNDPDAGESETFTITALPTAGTLKLNGSPLQLNGTFTQANINMGQLSYAAGGASGADGFTFTVSNGVGGTVGSTTFQINTIAPQTFKPGDLLVYRVGDGFGELVNNGDEVFLNEYTTSGALVQSIPVSDSGGTPLIANGTATSEGLISLSANGAELLMTGYQAGLATQSSFIGATFSTSIPRAIGVVSPSGAVDLSTTTTQFSTQNPTSATGDGSTLWVVGANSGVVTLQQGGSGAGTVVSTTNTNIRAIQIFNGQLYYSTDFGIWSVGTGEPTSTGTVAIRLPGMTFDEAYGFFFANLGSGNSFNGYDTLYVADDKIPVSNAYVGGIEKWSYNGTIWTMTGSAAAKEVRGLAGVVNNGVVTLYGTTGTSASAPAGGGSIYTFIDSTGAGGAMSGTATIIASAAANEAFRGVAFVPAAVQSVPISKVNSMSTRQTSNTFNVTANFIDNNGVGIASVDLYVSTNNGSFRLYQSQSEGGAVSGTASFTFNGQDRNIYAFYSVAHGESGSVETKSAIEASTYAPDLHPPVTQVLNTSSYGNGVFTLNWSGTDPDANSGTPPGSIVSVSIFAFVDGGAARLIGTFSAGTATGGVYSGSTTYAALGDGLSHTYGFYSVGVDDLGVTETAPGTPDVTFSSITFTTPLAASSLTVEKGIAERSFIRYLAANFNQSLSSTPPSPALTSLQAGLVSNDPGAFVELEYYGSNLTPTSPPVSAVTLFGSGATVTLSDSTLSIDFGTKGLTGTPTTSTGDGWYALGIDPTGNPSNGQVFWLTFYRLLGDANGDKVVTGPVSSSGTDLNAVNAARGQTNPLLNGDVNGDGTVNTTDLAETTVAVGHGVGSVPPQNFPTFQVMAGRPGTGNVTAITQAQVQSLIPAATAAWQKAGVNQAGVTLLQNAQIQVINLGGNVLGQELPGLIQINATAGGFAWNLNASAPAATQVDLLTVLEHEMGHVLGLPDNVQAGDLMNIGLGQGTVRTPSKSDVAALDQALQTAGNSFAGDTLPSISSPSQFRMAVELIFTQTLRSTPMAPIAQPTSSLVTDRRSPAAAGILSAAAGVRSLLATAPTAIVISSDEAPTNDPGQLEFSYDLFQTLSSS